MFTLVLFVHGFLCIFLILLVLVQQGKGADAGALMGSGAESILGAGSAGSFMSRITTGAAIAFMATSILLVKLYTMGGAAPRQAVDPLQGSMMNQVAPREEAAPPEAPAEAPQSAPAPAAEPPAAQQAPQIPAQNPAPADSVAGK